MVAFFKHFWQTGNNDYATIVDVVYPMDEIISNTVYIDCNKLQKQGACDNCKRPLVTKDMLTKNGCIWCDAEYHTKEKK